MSNTHCIYKITNTSNGKYYVGRTKAERFPRRKREHFSALRAGRHCNPKLQASFNKWGENSFVMDPQITDLTKSEAIEFEQLCLDEVVGMPQCYNISTSAKGGGSKGYKHTVKAKQQISEANLGRKLSEEHKRKVSEANKIALTRPEVKRRKSEAAKNQWKQPEMLRKHRQALGKPFTCTWPDGSVRRYLSLNEAASELNVGDGTIHNYLTGFRTPGGNKKTAHLQGCTFEYCTLK